MDSTEQILEWAESHAEELTKEMRWTLSEFGSGGYWEAWNGECEGRIRARAIAALAFLERFAGTDSRWTQDARGVFDNRGDRQSMESGARAIGDVVGEWVRAVRSGQATPRLAESAGVRAVASTDLLEQVRVLNADQRVAPAAPIVLAGAALEIALRAAIEELDLTVKGRPSIDSYAKALRNADVVSRQDMKDITQMAGLRNQAAHGKHEELSRERSGLMEQQVNHFLRRLEEAIQRRA